MDSRHGTVNPEGSKSGTRRRKRTSSGSCKSEESSGGSSSSSEKIKRKRCPGNDSQDEFKKAKPPTFNGDIKKGQEAEAWSNFLDPLTDEEDATMVLTIRDKSPMNMYIHKMVKC